MPGGPLGFMRLIRVGILHCELLSLWNYATIIQLSAEKKAKDLQQVLHLLFRRGIDLIIRRCAPEGEQRKILEECHASPYGGHFAGDKTTHKIIQSGFCWSTIFKDFFEWVKLCDQCQRMRNISKRHEMPLQGILVVKLFDVWGIDFMGHFPVSF